MDLVVCVCVGGGGVGLLTRSLHSGYFFMLVLSSADFFSKLTFSKDLSGTLSELHMVWIQIRPDILSVLILLQAVCKGSQQAKKSQLFKRGKS